MDLEFRIFKMQDSDLIRIWDWFNQIKEKYPAGNSHQQRWFSTLHYLGKILLKMTRVPLSSCSESSRVVHQKVTFAMVTVSYSLSPNQNRLESHTKFRVFWTQFKSLQVSRTFSLNTAPKTTSLDSSPFLTFPQLQHFLSDSPVLTRCKCFAQVCMKIFESVSPEQSFGLDSIF